MNNEKKYKLKGKISEEQKYLIEAEIEVKPGVNNVEINPQSKEAVILFDKKKISEAEILKIFKQKGLDPEENELKECVLYVEGMHCSSCEVLIEKRITKIDGVKLVDASASKGEILIEYTRDKPKLNSLNKMFAEDDYNFSEKKIKQNKKNKSKKSFEGKIILDKEKTNNTLFVIGIALLLITGFLFLHNSSLSALVNVTQGSSLSMFFLFGLLAGFSSCAALVGGIVLSMSKQWMANYSTEDSNSTKLQPHLLFNSGRIISYAFFGAILGGLGSFFQLSISFTAILVLAVSVMMIFLALQMMGFAYFQRFQIATPKFITRYIANESNFNGKYMPFLMGALTFFLPCGFTITAQGLALASGSILQGTLIMTFFALGTLPALLAIGYSSVAFSKNKKNTEKFMKLAGILVLFFAFFNINSQMNVLGLPSLEDISLGNNAAIASAEGLPPIVDGKQILKMDALAYTYKPSNLKVRAGVPVRWEISDKGTSGCTNAIISKGLFEGQIPLSPGKTSVKEFTPEKAGRYKFSCWMGMVSGSIDVVDVDSKGAVVKTNKDSIDPVPAGASGGCGCGGGGGGSCGR